MRLFLDTSVLLAASGSGKGASRFAVTEAVARGWELVSSDYCDEETRRNLSKVGRSAALVWKNEIAPRVRFVRASVALDKALVFSKAKDRPVVITALACGRIGCSPSTRATSTRNSAVRFTVCASPRPASF